MSEFPSSITHGASLAVIAMQSADASATHRSTTSSVAATLYRWSPAHRGGPYPLLRTVAKLLDLNHHAVVLPFETHDGFCVVSRGQGEATGEAWTVLEFDQPATPS